jgi:hypothetical protein
LNPTPYKTQLEDQRSRKTQKDHLEEGNATLPIKDTKRGKQSQNGKDKLRKAQKYKKLTKLKNSP